MFACGLALLGLGGGISAAQDKTDDKTAPPDTAAEKPAQTAAPAPAVAAPAPAPVINFRERPPFPTDPQRLRRTIQVDGVLSDGEWDPFYTITSGPVKGTVFCNWDENYLYLAVRTDAPSAVLLDVDCGGDGWLRSADNLELVIGKVPDGGKPEVIARLLNAANSKDAPMWNEKAVDPKSILVAGKVVNGTQILEIGIPKNTASLVLRPGVAIGLRAEFLPIDAPAGYTPTQPFEPHLLLDATLVDTKAQAAFGINPTLTISDRKCIAGQKLFATLELRNQTDALVPLRSVFWSGQGTSTEAVNSVREVTVPSIPALKTIKLKYTTVLPPTISVGSYALQVVAELGNGKQVHSAITFAVVEPLQVQMSSDPQPVAMVGQTKLSVKVDVYSAVPNGMGGTVELTKIPQGWEIKSAKRGFSIDREDGNRAIFFDFKIPSTTPAGDYDFEAAVTWNKRTWKVQHTVHVTRADTPVKP